MSTADVTRRRCDRRRRSRLESAERVAARHERRARRVRLRRAVDVRKWRVAGAVLSAYMSVVIAAPAVYVPRWLAPLGWSTAFAVVAVAFVLAAWRMTATADTWAGVLLALVAMSRALSVVWVAGQLAILGQPYGGALVRVGLWLTIACIGLGWPEASAATRRAARRHAAE